MNALNRMRIAWCEHLMGNQDSAAWDAIEAHKLDPLNGEYVRLAIKYNRLANRPDVGISIAKSFLEKIDFDSNPQNIERILLEAAYCSELSKDWKGFSELLENDGLSQFSENYYFYKGVSHYNLRQIEIALTAFLEYQKLQLDHLETKLNIIDCYIYLNKIPEASKNLNSISSNDMSNRFYEAKAIVSSYEQDEAAIVFSILEFEKNGGDGVELSFRCADILFPINSDLSMRIIVFSTKFKTKNSHLILRKIAMDVCNAFVFNQENTELKKKFLEIENDVTTNPLFSFVKGMMLLLQKDKISFETHVDSFLGPTNVHFDHLISGASFLGWGELVLKLLQKKMMCKEFIQIPDFKFPDDKTFEFFAYLDIGDISKSQIVGSLLQAENHLLDLLAKAYNEYLFGALENALKNLNLLDAKYKFREVLLLKRQVLIELGKYQMVSKNMKVLNIKQKEAMDWWGRQDIQNLNQIASLAPANFEIAGHINDSDYVILIFDGNQFSRIALGTRDWLGCFTYLHGSGLAKEKDTPILMRGRVPIKTAQSFREAGRID